MDRRFSRMSPPERTVNDVASSSKLAKAVAVAFFRSDGAREKEENVHSLAMPSRLTKHIIRQSTMTRFSAVVLAAGALLLAKIGHVHGFVTQSTKSQNTNLFAESKKGFFSDFFAELDAFVDDATSRRLGAGSAFYGKRKSNFYGSNDKGRKVDRDVPDPTEDYQGPAKSGYFQWMMDEETGQMKPVTRMKKRVVERNPNYWDKVYGGDKNE